MLSLMKSTAIIDIASDNAVRAYLLMVAQGYDLADASRFCSRLT